MPTFLFCEDNNDTVQRFITVWGRSLCVALGDGWKLEHAASLNEALVAIESITENDIVSLDSRIPDAYDGERVLVALREKGCKCLALWHSPVAVPGWAKEHCFKFSSWTRLEIDNLRNKWSERKDLTDCTPPSDCHYKDSLHELVARLSALDFTTENSAERARIENGLRNWWDGQPENWREDLRTFLDHRTEVEKNSWADHLSEWCSGKSISGTELHSTLCAVAEGCL